MAGPVERGGKVLRGIPSHAPMRPFPVIVVLALLVLGIGVMLRGADDAPAPGAPTTAVPPAPPLPAPTATGERTAATPSVPAADTASRAADASAELTADECRALERTLSEGELEVLVRRGREPVAGAAVTLWPPYSARERPWLRGEAPRERGVTDAEGRVVFRGLGAGGTSVRVEANDGEVTAEAAGRGTHVVLFGSRALTGTVCDERGAPLAGATIFVSGVGPLPSRGAATTTARDGTFAFGHLVAGRYHVQVLGDVLPFPANERTVTLRAGQRTEVHFGGAPRGGLRGRVVDARGTTIPGRHELRAREAARNDERRVITADDGTFVLPLPPGTWHFATGEMAALEGTDLGHAVIGAHQVDGTLPLPGIRLVLRLQGPAAAEVPLTDFSLWRGEQVLSPFGEFTRDGARYVHWLGLVPGEHVLRLHNHVRFLDAPRAGFVFALVAAQPVDERVVNLAR